MSTRATRQKVRKLEGPRAPGPAGRPAMEIRCAWCHQKLAEAHSLADYYAAKRAGVTIRCHKCRRDKVL